MFKIKRYVVHILYIVIRRGRGFKITKVAILFCFKQIRSVILARDKIKHMYSIKTI